MDRKWGIGFLILCFGFSNVNLGWATQVMDVAPVVVQPYELQELNQQMIDRDRQNRDEEIAIKGLVEDNDKLTQATLARQQDEGLAKINQTMLSYRDALVSRDRARIVANGQRWWTSRYGDLIALTEDADAMTVHQDLENKSDLLAEKYQMLTQLKDEMTALNEKLTNRQENVSDQKEAAFDSLKGLTQQQQDKVQMLVSRLGEMDQKIAHLDDVIAQKDRQIAQLKSDASVKDETIKEQQDQISILQATSKGSPSSPTNRWPLPPANVNTSNDQQPAAAEINPSVVAAKDAVIKEKQDQVDLLKSELENKITELNDRRPQNEIIKDQENQIAVLKAQAQELRSKEDLINSQSDQMAKASEQFKDQSATYAKVQAQVMDLRDKMNDQDLDLKAKNDSIAWLKQVVAANKNKAQYYQLTSQQDQMSMKQVQEEVQNIKDDFAKRFKDYDQFENAIVSLKSQVSQLGLQLSQKRTQVDLLKSELQDKIVQEKDQKEQIVKMKADILAILQAQANKEIYHHQIDDRVELAKQLIDLQWQETALLDEKSNLEAVQNARFDQYAMNLEKKIKGLLVTHQIQTVDLQNRLEELQNELTQKEQQVEFLNTELRNKIAEEKNQGMLEAQIQDLKGQLQDNQDLITTLKQDVQEGQKTQEEADSLKQQLAAQQDRADLLKQQLDGKTAESYKMTAMMGEYQKKLESKDNAYNEQLGKIMDLNAQLQDKEAQVVKIKKDMYDLQESTSAKDTDVQTKELNLTMVQQKMMDEKIKEYQDKIDGLRAANVKQALEITNLRNVLAQVRQQLKGTPSSDELVFLRAGLQKATTLLKKKDQDLTQIKADFDEYSKEFKSQSQEFQSLKDQLLNAQEEIKRKDEDLKYKDLAIQRLKDFSKTGGRVESLRAQLTGARLQIKDLQGQLNRLRSPFKNDPLEEKLKQALDKIDEQGRVINTLVQKLQDYGHSVDLTKITGNE